MLKLQAVGVGLAAYIAALVIGGMLVGYEPGPGRQATALAALVIAIAAGVAYHRRRDREDERVG